MYENLATLCKQLHTVSRVFIAQKTVNFFDITDLFLIFWKILENSAKFLKIQIIMGRSPLTTADHRYQMTFFSKISIGIT